MKKKPDQIAVTLVIPPAVAAHINSLLLGMANNKKLSSSFRHYCTVKYNEIFKKLPLSIQESLNNMEKFLKTDEGKEAMTEVKMQVSYIGEKMLQTTKPAKHESKTIIRKIPGTVRKQRK